MTFLRVIESNERLGTDKVTRIDTGKGKILAISRYPLDVGHGRYGVIAEFAGTLLANGRSMTGYDISDLLVQKWDRREYQPHDGPRPVPYLLAFETADGRIVDQHST